MNEKTRELGEQNVGKLMVKYFIPAFIGVFVNALYNIVDRIFIGQGVGALALSGVSVIFPIMLIMMAFGMLIGIGTGVLVSINLGKKNIDKAERGLGTSLVLLIVVSVVISAVGFIIKAPLLKLFGATPETIKYANDYLNIILFGVVFQELGFSFNNIIRSEGNAKVAMVSMLISAGTNLVLDPLFIFVFDLGVKGAAYATVISMIVLSIWVTTHFTKKRSVIKLKASNIKFDLKITGEILTFGMAPFFMQSAGSVINGLVTVKLIKFGGDLAVGAMGIVNSVASLIVMSIVAINMASQPIIGFNYGAKECKRVRETVKLSIISATIISIVAYFLVEFAPEILVKLFNSDSMELLELGATGLRIGLFALPLIGFQIVISNYYQAIGKGKTATVLTLSRQVIFLIPLLFILPHFYQLNGIWIAMPVADTLSALLTGIVFINEWKRLSTSSC